MSNPLFNVEVTAVENGWIVSVIRVRDGDPTQKDYIVENGSIKTFIGGLVDQEVDAADTYRKEHGGED